MDCEPLASFNPGFGCQVCHALVCLDVLRAAIGVAAVVEGVDADKYMACFQYFGPGQGKGEKDGVAGGNIRNRNALSHLLQGAAFWHVNITGQRGAAKEPQVNLGNDMLGDAQMGGNPFGGLNFGVVALTIAKSKGI